MCTLIGSFFPKHIKFRLKSTEEPLCLMTLKSDPKKSKFLINVKFLYDAIDLTQSVEGTLKV